MISRVEKIEQYLVKNIEQLDLIVEDVVSLVPYFHFYSPEFKGGEFLEMREEMNRLQRKKNSFAYRYDNSTKRAFKKLCEQYHEALRSLSVRKRQSLKEELLAEADEVKCACLMNLIREYDLLKSLRTFS